MDLIICSTPFHILLSEEIIRSNPNRDYLCLIFVHTKNDKIKYYIHRLKQLSNQVRTMDVSSNLKWLMTIFYLRLFSNLGCFNKVYLASVDNILVHSILTKIEFISLFTFDDGTINLLYDGRYYEDDYVLSERVFRKVLNISYDAQRIRSLSKKHYTIYDAPNIIENTEMIQLVHEKESKAQSGTSVSILLGQPLYAEDKQSQILFDNIVNKLQPDFYLPHPRETFEVEGVDYVHTNYVLEDYIVHLRNQFETVKLYTVSSSAILNVMQLSGIEVYGIKVDDFENHQDILRRFDVPIIDLEME